MSPVSNKFENAVEKHTEKLCIQAVQDARQASALKMTKRRENTGSWKPCFSKSKTAVLLTLEINSS